MRRHVLATVGGRHNLPAVDVNFFDGAVENPMDFGAIENHVREVMTSLEPADASQAMFVVYVTGLTTVTTSVLKIAAEMHTNVTLMHYNRDTDDYEAQYFVFQSSRQLGARVIS